MPSKKSVPADESAVRTPIYKKYWWVSLCVLGVVGLAVGGYYFYQYQQAQKLLNNPTLSAQQQRDELVAKVGKLIDLPKDEVPSVATVTDVEKLKGQPFFEKAQNGHKVLIYQKAKIAYLYDPAANKLVQVGPVNEPPMPTQAVPSSVKVVVYNGTTTSGLAAKVEQQLLSVSSIKIEVVSKGNAKQKTYTKPLVIDVSGTNSEAASRIAGILSGEVGKLPAGEVKPENADILVIAGQE